MEVLDQLPEKSVDSCITSPPYYGLRDYNTGKWVGGDPDCPHKRMTKISKDTDTGHKNMYEHGDVVGDAIYKSVCPKWGATREDKQIGLEDSPEEYVESMVEVFRKVRRVLKDEGTVWLNLGDSYVSTHPTGTRDSDTGWKHGELSQGHQARAGGAGGIYKVKDLMGIPWMVALALRADGWYLRQDIIWHKPNPMPESVKDRCTKSHEYIFLLTKQNKYYYDNDAIREPHTWEESKPRPSGMERNAQKYRAKVNYGGGGSGFAGHSGSLKADGTSLNHPDGRNKRSVWTVTTKPFTGAHFAVFPPDLIEPCVLAGCPKDGTVLDPFGGAGTTGLVADRNDRNAILIELNDEYAEMARDRLYNDAPLFVDVE